MSIRAFFDKFDAASPPADGSISLAELTTAIEKVLGATGGDVSSAKAMADAANAADGEVDDNVEFKEFEEAITKALAGKDASVCDGLSP